MATDEIHVDDNEESGQAAVGGFTVEARAEGVSEDYAEALAVKLAALGLTVWIKGGGDG